MLARLAAGVAMFAAAGCHKSEVPPPVVVVDAAATSAAPAPIRDAATDVGDARDGARDGVGDASDAGAPHRHGHGAAKKPAGAGGDGAAGVKVEGTLPKEAAEKIVRAGAGALRACYDAEQAKNPALKGKVTFRLAVDDRGRVSLGEVVTSTLGGGDPEMCMVRAARDFRFPTGNGESTVSFQMSFGR
jgi:hypothetical protein